RPDVDQRFGVLPATLVELQHLALQHAPIESVGARWQGGDMKQGLQVNGFARGDIMGQRHLARWQVEHAAAVGREPAVAERKRVWFVAGPDDATLVGYVQRDADGLL